MTTQHAADEAATEPTPTIPPTNNPDIIAIAWPTSRPIYPYTREEIAEGVDLYTRAIKARVTTPGGHRAR